MFIDQHFYEIFHIRTIGNVFIGLKNSKPLSLRSRPLLTQIPTLQFPVSLAGVIVILAIGFITQFSFTTVLLYMYVSMSKMLSGFLFVTFTCVTSFGMYSFSFTILFVRFIPVNAYRCRSLFHYLSKISL